MTFSIPINKSWHSAWWQSVVMLSVVMLSVVMLSVIMLNVPYKPFVLNVICWVSLVWMSLCWVSWRRVFQADIIRGAYPKGSTHSAKALVINVKLSSHKRSSLFSDAVGDEKFFFNIDASNTRRKNGGLISMAETFSKNSIFFQQKISFFTFFFRRSSIFSISSTLFQFLLRSNF